MADDKPIPPSAKLLDEEARQHREHRDKISRVALELEGIFLREHLTMGDVLEIQDLFNSRANKVFSETKISHIKETYDRQTQ